MTATQITITEAANAYIEKMLAKNHGIGFRLSIKKTGCSGYSYVPTIIEKINASDVMMETKTGIKIFIDVNWLHLLHGITIDYLEEKVGLKQKRLIFTNPQEANRCGCGESFHIE